MYKLGIDLGGTKIEGVVLDETGHEILRLRYATRQKDGYDVVIKQIAALYNSLVVSIEAKPHSLGVCTPGAADRATGLLRFCNIACMNGRNPRQDLQDETGVQLALTNDANCFALAEALLGAGRSGRFVFGMVLGTGCGGGLVIDQKIWEGRTGIAGEWGHSTLSHGGRACYCGHQGCVERYLSGSAIEEAYHAITGCSKSVPEIVAARKSGEPHAGRVIEEFLDAFGLATANLIKIFDPDVIVLGGGVSNIPELYSAGRERVIENIMGKSIDTLIVPNALGDSAGVLGAALHGYELRTSC